ncbi:MAG: AAA family ATPase [Lachnospiraceae bacterium]
MFSSMLAEKSESLFQKKQHDNYIFAVSAKGDRLLSRRENNMNAFDKIIGYSAVKKELQQICDTLINTELYKKLGVTAPQGLLFHGEPGVGKSLMATAIIETSERKAFICHKDRSNGAFIKEIKETFEKAAQNAPSIVYLDDMDKFTNGDEQHPDAEEYVTVQSCIDKVKGKQVFVLATANNIRCLPRSLLRAGRFDRIIEIEAPKGKDAVEIVAHYIENKKFSNDVDPKTVAHILDGRSCAELETVINEAGLYAGYEGYNEISMNHFTKACMRTIFNTSPSFLEDLEYTDNQSLLSDLSNTLTQIIYHEAGHVVVSEVLCPESVTLVSAQNNTETRGGFTAYYTSQNITQLYESKSQIIGALGGIAAIEQKFGIFDTGCDRDLNKAFDIAKSLVVNNCICGFHLHKNKFEDSQRLWSEQEHSVASEIEKYYRKAKEILSKNNEFFEKVAKELNRKGLISGSDIYRIKSDCLISTVDI